MPLVILTEEESMQVTLQSLLPRLGVTDFQIMVFDGVSDLERSLVRRIRAWRVPQSCFLVIRDNDNGDCVVRKQRLLNLIARTGTTRPTKVRIVMQELEAWFLGDPVALEQAGILPKGRRPASLRDPEAKSQPVNVLKELLRGYGKVSGARRIAPHLHQERNSACSFHTTVAAIRELTTQHGA